jgi:hypothetical protein
MSARLAGLTIGATLLALSVPPASAQAARTTPIIRADLMAGTRDLRRGIRNNAHMVGELDAVLGLQRGSVSLTAGAWSQFEANGTSGEPRPDLRAGPAGLTDWSTWLQLAHRTRRFTISGGVIRDFYRRVGGDPAVTELYGTTRLQIGRWATGLSAWQATAGADGLYFEPTIAFHHIANPFVGPGIIWTSTLRAGFQVGPRRPDGGAKVPGPFGTGLTAIGLNSSIRPEFGLGPVALVMVLGFEAQINRDDATRLRRDGTRRGWFRIWAPLQLGLSYPARRRP